VRASVSTSLHCADRVGLIDAGGYVGIARCSVEPTSRPHRVVDRTRGLTRLDHGQRRNSALSGCRTGGSDGMPRWLCVCGLHGGCTEEDVLSNPSCVCERERELRQPVGNRCSSCCSVRMRHSTLQLACTARRRITCEADTGACNSYIALTWFLPASCKTSPFHFFCESLTASRAPLSYH
jgi:hypothetical protein